MFMQQPYQIKSQPYGTACSSTRTGMLSPLKLGVNHGNYIDKPKQRSAYN